MIRWGHKERRCTLRHMNKRIKLLRKSLNLTQQEFADKLNIKRGAVSNYEVGRNQPIDAVISLICKEFNVNEDWLRFGKGDMLLPFEDEVGEVVSKLVDESNPFYDMIIDIMHTFNNLDDKGQEIICNFTSDLVDRMAKRNKQDN